MIADGGKVESLSAKTRTAAGAGAGAGAGGGFVAAAERGLISRSVFMTLSVTRSSGVAATAALWARLRESVRGKVRL